MGDGPITSLPYSLTEMQQSTARRRKSGSRTPDHDIVDDSKHVRTFSFSLRWMDASTCSAISSTPTGNKRLSESPNPLYYLSYLPLVSLCTRYAHSFSGAAENSSSCDCRKQYSAPARRVVFRWLGQEGTANRHLPGWSTSTYIGLEADTPKRDAIVEAFQVRPPTQSFVRFYE